MECGQRKYNFYFMLEDLFFNSSICLLIGMWCVMKHMGILMKTGAQVDVVYSEPLLANLDAKIAELSTLFF